MIITQSTLSKQRHSNRADNDPILTRRGIAHAAARMGWVADGKYYSYRVSDEIRGGQRTRLKAIDRSKVDSAYLWGAGEAVTYYHPPNLQDAIAAADGLLYIAAGEVDVLTFMEAGANNVLACFGEGSVPDTLAADLSGLGVTRVMYWPDRDDAGKLSAGKVRDLLSGSGNHLEIKQLPEAVGKKGDTNDLWQLLNFDSVAFFEVLHNAPDLPLPAPEPKRPTFDSSSFGNQDTPPELIRDIASALNLQSDSANSKGWARKNVCCPFHDDKNPSATLNLKSGVLRCHSGCQTSFSPHKVVERLNIDWKRYYPEQPRKRRKSRQQPDGADAAPDENDISTWAQPVELPAFPAKHSVNLRYISDIDPALIGPTNLIKSPIATGKTELIIREIKRLDKVAKKRHSVLILTHSQPLTHNLTKRTSETAGLGFVCYDETDAGIRGLKDRIICTYDSAASLGRYYDLVFIDETDQFHRHLSSGTMKKDEANRAYTALKDIVGSAWKVYFLDAHLSATSVEWAQDIREDVNGVNTIENTYRHQWGSLLIQQYWSAVLAAALTAADGDTKGVVIPVNTKSQTRTYEALARERFKPEEILTVNGNTSSSKEARDFLRKLTNPANSGKSLYKALGIRVLICSPSVATGVDVQLETSGVYGVFTNQSWVNAFNIMQMMMRYRRADERHICIIGGKRRDNPKPTNWKDLHSHQEQRANSTARAADFGAHGVDALAGEQRSILKLQSMLDADTNVQGNDLFSYVVAVAQDEGFTIEYADGRDKLLEAAHKAIKEAIKQTDEDKTLPADVTHPDEYEAMRQRGNMPLEILESARYGVERWHIEHAAGQPITPDLYSLLRTRRKRADFIRLVDILDDVEHLKARDRNEAANGTLVIKRHHYTRNHDLLVMAWQAVFGNDYLNSTVEVTEADIKDRLETFIRLHLAEIQLYLDKRIDLSTTGINILRRLLKRAQMKLSRRQIMEGGERFMVYFIDSEHRDKLLAYGRIALQARKNRELEAITTNTYRDSLDIRECSNPYQPGKESPPDEGTHARWQAQIEAIPN